MFIKPTSEDSRKVKKNGNYALKRNLYLHFLIKQKLLISSEKMLTSAERIVLTLEKHIDFLHIGTFVLFQLINIGTTTNWKLCYD